MKGSLKFEYTWRLNDIHLNNGSNEVLEKHKQALIETAEDRILEMKSEGFLCGELHDFIIMDDEDAANTDSEGVSYSGSWKIVDDE